MLICDQCWDGTGGIICWAQVGAVTVFGPLFTILGFVQLSRESKSRDTEPIAWLMHRSMPLSGILVMSYIFDLWGHYRTLLFVRNFLIDCNTALLIGSLSTICYFILRSLHYALLKETPILLRYTFMSYTFLAFGVALVTNLAAFITDRSWFFGIYFLFISASMTLLFCLFITYTLRLIRMLEITMNSGERLFDNEKSLLSPSFDSYTSPKPDATPSPKSTSVEQPQLIAKPSSSYAPLSGVNSQLPNATTLSNKHSSNSRSESDVSQASQASNQSASERGSTYSANSAAADGARASTGRSGGKAHKGFHDSVVSSISKNSTVGGGSLPSSLIHKFRIMLAVLAFIELFTAAVTCIVGIGTVGDKSSDNKWKGVTWSSLSLSFMQILALASATWYGWESAKRSTADGEQQPAWGEEDGIDFAQSQSRLEFRPLPQSSSNILPVVRSASQTHGDRIAVNDVGISTRQSRTGSGGGLPRKTGSTGSAALSPSSLPKRTIPGSPTPLTRSSHQQQTAALLDASSRALGNVVGSTLDYSGIESVPSNASSLAES